MTTEYVGKTFKSGNSLALRLPKGLGMVEGKDVRIVQDAPMTFRVEPVDVPKRKIDLTGIAGSMPWLKPLTREEREFDDSPRVWDDPDWTGWPAAADDEKGG
jgi:antitoxin VapB